MSKPMGWNLGVIDDAGFKSVRALSDDEYKEYRFHAERLAEFDLDHKLLTMLSMNLKDYYGTLGRYVEEYGSKLAVPSSIGSHFLLDVNRHILNYMASVRTDVDHLETRLKKRFGKDSAEVNNFKAATRHAYDSSFADRLLWRLRNYAQHCGMPVGRLQGNARVIRREPVEVSRDLVSVVTTYCASMGGARSGTN